MIDNLNSASNEDQISINAVVSNSFVKKYSILKFPQFFFFRKGNFVQYKGLYANIAFLNCFYFDCYILGELSSKRMFDWIEKTMYKKTFILTDNTFEHDTQASTGATTGSWFVLFYNTDCPTKLLIESNWEQAAIKYMINISFL